MINKILTKVVIFIFTLVVVTLMISIFPIPGFNLRLLVVQSGSMEPAIKTGSIVAITPSDNYFKNDIITFQRSESLLDMPITHRIVKKTETEGSVFYTVKGDANVAPDNTKVFPDQVIGKVDFTIPFIGSVIDRARTPIGFLALIILPASLIISEEVKNIFKEARKNNKNKTA